MKVKIVAYKGVIIISPVDAEKDIGDHWIPTDQLHAGCVLIDTKKYLGVSEEAFELMKKVPRGGGSWGDLDWFRCEDGKYSFSWIGPIYRVVVPAQSEASRDFHVHDGLWEACTKIPNEVPGSAKFVVDTASDINKLLFWGYPHQMRQVMRG